MFGRGKKVNFKDIKNFRDAVRAIRWYIYLSEWVKANTAITELEDKEKAAFEELEHHLKNDYTELQKQKKKYEKNRSVIIQLKKEYEVKKIKYERKISSEKFHVRFDSIKKEIEKLSLEWDGTEALAALTSFFEENKNNYQVVLYYAREKKRIAKNMKKQDIFKKKKKKQSTELEALRLAGITLKNQKIAEQEKEKQIKENQQNSFFWRIRESINFHKKLKAKYREKQLLDEIRLLTEESSKVKQDIAKQKLSHMHQWLIKEIEKNHLIGFDLYGKILGSDKISGDCFGMYESKEKYSFYMGDATGHWVQAWLIVSILSKTFTEQARKDDIVNLVYQINNTLKESLQSKHFITGMIFEIDKKYKNIVNIAGMWHEPLLIYRAETKTVEKFIAGGLAAGIRYIKKPEDIKPKPVEIHDGDIFMSYSDGVIETKNAEWNIYTIDKLAETLWRVAPEAKDIKDLYSLIMQDVEAHRWWTKFDDDASIFIFSRNSEKDLLTEWSEELSSVAQKEGFTMKDMKSLEWKRKVELKEEVEKIKHEKKLDSIINSLKGHYYTGEYLKLKEEATRYVKEGFVHEKINFYLKKALENEDNYKISQKNTKMSNKYMVLQELYKKKEYTSVIQECNEIIAKDGNI